MPDGCDHHQPVRGEAFTDHELVLGRLSEGERDIDIAAPDPLVELATTALPQRHLHTGISRR